MVARLVAALGDRPTVSSLMYARSSPIFFACGVVLMWRGGHLVRSFPSCKSLGLAKLDAGLGDRIAESF
jgi:hypothetical protein